ATTAAIRHGSSGGALFNQNGQLIGMTSSFGGESYYSIPARFIEELPRNLNIPLKEISSITPTLRAPKNISVSVEQREAHVSWEPIYGIDYFHLYISSELNGEYTKIKNPKNQSDQWFWGYPYCFGMAVNHPKECYLKIVAVQNGVSSAPSEIIKVVIE
ncbi:MAG: trypsin-like peptidase domain-containing protein, partial [Epulopiscium sp.]|nr:trypsin-like peptidase domain-containing protein [Candidatus Epulonipiscium sp.]